MTTQDKSFRQAQAKYDRMEPPEEVPQIDCETCGGDGRVDEADEDGKNLRPLCVECDGKGTVDAPEPDYDGPDPRDEDGFTGDDPRDDYYYEGL
jgi:hypothetical protein